MSEHKSKKANYISSKESARISRFNRKLTKRLEKQRNRKKVNPDTYMTKMKDSGNVVEFDNVCSYFFTDIGTVKAVDGASFVVPKCSTVGIVGESGCGKSVTSLSLMQLLQRPHGQTVGGEIRFNVGEGDSGEAIDIAKAPNEVVQHMRGNRMAMIFQEPMTSLNPVFRIGFQVDEVIKLHNPEMNKEDVKKRTLEMLELVGIANKEGVYEMYPHELSGGMRQRIMIAIALSCNPELIIADEPTTALDVTIQAQILRLMNDLKRENGTSILFITHDLGVINQMADYVAVMYCGQVVERVPAKMLFDPKTEYSHPYTEGLLVSIPRLDTPTNQRLEAIPGAVPHPLDLPKGCKFAPRCKYATEKCHEAEPPMTHLTEEHHIRCYYPNKEERKQNVK